MSSSVTSPTRLDGGWRSSQDTLMDTDREALEDKLVGSGWGERRLDFEGGHTNCVP